MRPIILATCTILVQLITLSSGFTVPNHRQLRTSRRDNNYRQLEGSSNGILCTNEIRIRQHGLFAVNIEQEKETQQITASSESDSINKYDSNNNIYELLGIQEGQLALGVKPEEVYKYIGTREELVSKTLTDIPTLNREMAETEVDKFLMDCEMVNMYIQYGKEVEKDPNFAVPDNDDADSNGWFTPRNIVAGYLTYVGVTSGPQIIRRYIAEQEVKGEWEPTNIPFLDQWIDNTSADATARVLQKAAEKAATAVESTTTTPVDASLMLPTDVLLTPNVVSDSLQSLVDTVTAVSP